MDSYITSLQNSLIKEIVRLQDKSAQRVSSGTFVVEGRREVSLALANEFEPLHLLVCPEIYAPEPHYPIPLQNIQGVVVHQVSISVYNKMAYRENAEGILMVAKTKWLTLPEFVPEHNTLIVLLEGVEKPGNLGAILRTTDASGVHAILLCNSRVDVFNPNVIRSSLGCVFSQKVIPCTNQEAMRWIKHNRFTLYAASPDTVHLYSNADLRKPCVVAFGAEDVGLSSEWLRAADTVIKIPMLGQIDSLNVGASVAIIAFEAVRQRQQDLI